MILEEKIKNLILKLEEERNSNYSFISSYQMNKLLCLLFSMLDNLSNKKGKTSNISDEINLIVRWSIDEWVWSTVTKEIMEIIEEYGR